MKNIAGMIIFDLFILSIHVTSNMLGWIKIIWIIISRRTQIIHKISNIQFLSASFNKRKNFIWDNS